MSGLSPKYPLTYDYSDGYYKLNKTYKEVISQNLKNLVLTSPGERIMDINFGVGIYNLLFENYTEDLREDVSTRISEQISKYMPFISLVSVDVSSGETQNKMFEEEPNLMRVAITYFVSSLNIEETLQISVSNI